MEPFAPDSLYGRATAILMELRGGPLAETEPLDVRLVADWIEASALALMSMGTVSGGAVLPEQQQMRALLRDGFPAEWVKPAVVVLSPSASAWQGLAVSEGTLPACLDILRVLTPAGGVMERCATASQARETVSTRPYKGQPRPGWWLRGRTLLVALPPRLAGLSSATAEVVPASLLGEGGDATAPSPLLGGAWWEPIRLNVLRNHGPQSQLPIDKTNDGQYRPE